MPFGHPYTPKPPPCPRCGTALVEGSDPGKPGRYECPSTDHDLVEYRPRGQRWYFGDPFPPPIPDASGEPDSGDDGDTPDAPTALDEARRIVDDVWSDDERGE